MLEIAVSDVENATIVAADGRIDSMSAGKLAGALSEAIAGGRVHIVLDLSAVDYMSSAGLREIVAAFKQAKRASGDLRVVRPSPRVMEVFEMAGLDTIIRIFPTQSEATSSYP